MPTYSHSKLGTFEQCRYKYKLQYIDRVKVDVPDTVETFLGGLVHKVLHKLYKDLQYQKLNTKEELLSYYDDLWLSGWDDAILIVKDFSKEHYRQMGIKFITDFYDHYKPFNSLQTIGLETEYMFPLNNGNLYHIRMDRLSCDKDGNYYVCDYKTNNKLKIQAELDEDRQLAMYSLWVRHNFKDAKAVKLVWYFLAFDKEMLSERSDEQLLKLKGDVENLVLEIEKCTEFPTSVSALCDWCEYKSMCPEWKHEISLEKKTLKEFSNDEGVVLVDKYAALKEEVRAKEDEMDKVKEDLVSFSKQKGVSQVFGTSRKVSLAKFETITFPPKEDRQALHDYLKKEGVWESVIDLDTYKLSRMVKEKQINLDRFIERKEGFRLSVGERR